MTADCSNTALSTRTEGIRELLALRRSNPDGLAALLAKRYVQRGSEWLRCNAPNPGWWRNCLDGNRSRVRLSYGNEGVLSLAFEYEARFADEFGYVQDYIVLRHFFGRSCPEKTTRRLGFTCGPLGNSMPFSKRNGQIVFTSELFDKVWAEFLSNPPPDWRINYRQPNAVEDWLRRSGVLGEPSRRGGWLDRLLRTH